MRLRLRRLRLSCIVAMPSATCILASTILLPAQETLSNPTQQQVTKAARGTAGAPFIPLDSWIYPAVQRLHDLGYLPTVYSNMRPYTRISLAHALELSRAAILADQYDYGPSDEAVALFDSLYRELAPELNPREEHKVVLESTYLRVRGIAGPPLNDSFHLGQTFANDYGRPFQEGLNVITGASAYATLGRFNLYVRGEYQHSPSGQGYSSTVAEVLKENDGITPGVLHPIIPEGRIAQRNEFRLLNANLSAHIVGHQISFGRTDEWLGPAVGGSMAWSNNAEPIYAFRVNRIEPIYFPIISRLTGPFRYEFFIGSLKGHDTPNDPWAHVEKVSFKPDPNIEFGFARVVLWGGRGHVPITVGTFVRSFVSPAGVTADVKFSRQDPGARFSTFDFSYRIPWKDHLFVIYADSFVHDDVFPISNPRRAAVRPGLLISRLPHLPKVDLRAEAAYTDVNDKQSLKGNFLFYEVVQRNGYTNSQFLLGDPIGRENKGGNIWLTWHVSPEQELRVEYKQAKASKDFILYGTTQNDLALDLRLRPTHNLEARGNVQGESWRAPLVRSGTQRNVSATIQLTWFSR